MNPSAPNTPIGTVSASTGESSSTSSPSPSSTSTSTFDSSTGSAPSSHIDLSDDALVKYGNMEKPVKFGEFHRGLQSQLTKKAQEASRATARIKQMEQAIAQRDQQLQRFQNGGGNGQPTKQNPLLDSIRSLPYLGGEDAARVVQHVESQLQSRDQALILIAQHLQKMNQQVSSFSQERGQSQFNTKIGSWLKELNLPDEAADFAKEIYLAYEGDDLDQEFPNILKTRWEGLQGLFRKQDQDRIAAAKQRTFVPSRGGNGVAQKPLNTGSFSAKQIADEYWPMIDSDT